MAEFVAQTIDLSKRFGKHRAVNSLGVRMERGSVYGLLGPNGAGKTTLLKMLVGLLRPTEGEVRLFGGRWRRGHLGRVPHRGVRPLWAPDGTREPGGA